MLVLLFASATLGANKIGLLVSALFARSVIIFPKVHLVPRILNNLQVLQYLWLDHRQNIVGMLVGSHFLYV